MKKIISLNKTVFVLGLVSLFTDLSSEMIYPVLPLFLANVIGASTMFIGLIEGIAESTASFLKVFSGWLSDKFGKRKQLVLAGYGLSSLVKPLLAVATSGWHVLGVRFVDRIGKGIRGAPRDAMIADVTEPDKRGRAFGFHRAMDTAGAVIGPAATFLILMLFGNNYRLLFLIAAVPALIAVAIIIFGIKEKRPQSPAGDCRIAPPVSNVRTERQKAPLSRQFIILLIIIGVFTLGNSSDAFLILRAQGAGIAVWLIPLLWLFFNLVYTLVSMPAGRLSDKIGRKRIILLGFIIYAASYLGLAFANAGWQIWALFGLYGVYYAMTEGVIRAHIADVVPEATRATSYGIYNFVVGVLVLPANLLTGWIWKVAGYQTALSVGAGLAILAAAGFAAFSFLYDLPTKSKM